MYEKKQNLLAFLVVILHFFFLLLLLFYDSILFGDSCRILQGSYEPARNKSRLAKGN